LFVSPSAAERRERAVAWLRGRRIDRPLWVVGATLEAAADLAREIAREREAGFGWQRTTLGRLAGALAAPLLAERRLAPAAGLPLEALCARAVHQLAQRGQLGPLAAIAERPGLPRATTAHYRICKFR